MEISKISLDIVMLTTKDSLKTPNRVNVNYERILYEKNKIWRKK